jgi:hypothetical protein
VGGGGGGSWGDSVDKTTLILGQREYISNNLPKSWFWYVDKMTILTLISIF